MMSLEITTETCHANLDLLIGTEILDRIVTTETVLCVQFKPPSLGESSVEHLRQEFKKIESHFSGMSLEIMRYLLTFPVGQASRNGLMHNVWGRKGATLGAIRQSVRRLNAALKVWEFGYTIRGSRKGIYRFVPLER